MFPPPTVSHYTSARAGAVGVRTLNLNRTIWPARQGGTTYPLGSRARPLPRSSSGRRAYPRGVRWIDEVGIRPGARMPRRPPRVKDRWVQDLAEERNARDLLDQQGRKDLNHDRGAKDVLEDAGERDLDELSAGSSDSLPSTAISGGYVTRPAARRRHRTRDTPAPSKLPP